MDIFELRPSIYGWFALFLSSEPTKDGLNEAKEQFLLITKKINSLENQKIYEKFKNFLNALFEANQEILSIDYASLFLGAKEGLLCPSESSYREKRIYGESTLKVMEFYIKQGFKKEDSFSEPDDHISMEFAFMSLLGGRLLKIARQEGLNSLKCHNLAKVQLDFLSDHLLRWISLWANDVKRFSETEFYKSLSELVECFIEFDKSLLENFCLSHKD